MFNLEEACTSVEYKNHPTYTTELERTRQSLEGCRALGWDGENISSIRGINEVHLSGLGKEIFLHARGSPYGVVLFGSPNSGKSSLAHRINHFMSSEVAVFLSQIREIRYALVTPDLIPILERYHPGISFQLIMHCLKADGFFRYLRVKSDRLNYRGGVRGRVNPLLKQKLDIFYTGLQKKTIYANLIGAILAGKKYIDQFREKMGIPEFPPTNEIEPDWNVIIDLIMERILILLEGLEVEIEDLSVEDHNMLFEFIRTVFYEAESLLHLILIDYLNLFQEGDPLRIYTYSKDQNRLLRRVNLEQQELFFIAALMGEIPRVALFDESELNRIAFARTALLYGILPPFDGIEELIDLNAYFERMRVLGEQRMMRTGGIICFVPPELSIKRNPVFPGPILSTNFSNILYLQHLCVYYECRTSPNCPFPIVAVDAKRPKETTQARLSEAFNMMLTVGAEKSIHFPQSSLV